MGIFNAIVVNVVMMLSLFCADFVNIIALKISRLGHLLLMLLCFYNYITKNINIGYWLLRRAPLSRALSDCFFRDNIDNKCINY